MNRNQPRTEAQKRIIEKAKTYIKSLYENFGTADQRYFDGCFRGYIHGLGESGIIPRQSEFHICKIDFYELKRRRALVMVQFMLMDGFNAIETGQTSTFDEIYDEVIINGDSQNE